MPEPVFAADVVRYRPDEPRERLYIGRSLESIRAYQKTATNDPEATFSDPREIKLSWDDIFWRVIPTDNAGDWVDGLREYFSHRQEAALLYISHVDEPILFD